MKRNAVLMTVCIIAGFPRFCQGFLSASRKVSPVGGRALGRRRRLVHECTPQNHLSSAENAFHVLARNGRSWQRLKDVVDLALSSDMQIKSVADIGTDHGLLAAALALSGRFDRVLGVDASERALQDGALTLKEEILEYRQEKQIKTPFSLNFRYGDGLKVVEKKEADLVCIAGMGVHTMLEIVSATEGKDLSLLDSIGCKKLVLQPTNCRPRNLIMLYDNIRDFGWQVEDERIEYLSSRWYFSTSFVRSDQRSSSHANKDLLPGMKVAESEQSDSVFQAYVEHHCAWLRRDKQVAGQLRGGEEGWLEAFDTK
jgi:tRNA A22 N-methylase